MSMSKCSSPLSPSQKPPNKSNNLILPLIPVVKTIKAINKINNVRSFSPIIEKLSRNNIIADKINKIKEELIKFRKQKKEMKNAVSKRVFLFWIGLCKYLNI